MKLEAFVQSHLCTTENIIVSPKLKITQCILITFCLHLLTATHEKGFILYLTSSHVSFLIVLKVYHLIWPHLNSGQRLSYYKKVFIFAFSIVCITLMGYFYYRHIVHCDSMGKKMLSLCTKLDVTYCNLW